MSDSTNVWLTRSNRYRAELWGKTGRLQRVVERNVPWFLPWDYGASRLAHQPKLLAVQEDSEGLLWFVGALPKRRLSRYLRERPSRPVGEQPVDLTSVEDMLVEWDGFIEVVDPRDGSLLASERLEFPLSGFVADGALYRLDMDYQSELVIRVYSVRLGHN